MTLPYFQSQILPFSQMQTTWKTQLDPLTQLALTQGLLLKNQALKNGVTVINHLLSRMQQGWFITDINGAAQIYRSAALNDSTLTLTSNAAVTINLWVF